MRMVFVTEKDKLVEVLMDKNSKAGIGPMDTFLHFEKCGSGLSAGGGLVMTGQLETERIDQFYQAFDMIQKAGFKKP